MTSEFLGVSWQFPLSLDENNQINLARYEDSIRQAIWIILGTARGERVMRPNFGCGIHDLVFAPNNAGTAGRVTSEVRQALIQWESRIDLLDVKAYPNPSEANQLLIEISYRVRSTNNQFNLVYPFYLE
jgi:phage baseplate assembly protein W